MASRTYEQWDEQRRDAYPTATHYSWDSYPISLDQEPVIPIAGWNPHNGRCWVKDAITGGSL